MRSCVYENLFYYFVFLIWLGNEFWIETNFFRMLKASLYCFLSCDPFENFEDILIPNIFCLSGILYLLYYEISWMCNLAYILFCVFYWMYLCPPSLQNYVHQFWEIFLNYFTEGYISFLGLLSQNYRRLAGLNNRSLFSYSSWGWKSKVRVPSGLISDEMKFLPDL